MRRKLVVTCESGTGDIDDVVQNDHVFNIRMTTELRSALQARAERLGLSEDECLRSIVADTVIAFCSA